MELNIEKFDPTSAQLNQLAEKSRAIVVKDITDKEAVEVAKRQRLELRGARVAIEKTGKDMRDDANKFAKAVIAKEKELIAIIKPEEERLKDIEEQAKNYEEAERRNAELPKKKEVLNSLGAEMSDEEILALDDFAFDARINAIKAELLDKQREELEAKERAIKEVEEEKKREEEAEKRAKAKLEREQKEEAERKEREAKQAEERKIAEQKKLEADKKYKEFLSKNNYEEGLFKIERTEKEVKLYKLVDTLTI